MPKLVKQTVTLPAPARYLYAMYLDPRMHQAITGAKAVVSAKRGSRFSAFDGMLCGRTLYTVSGRLIVQAWRSGGWKKGDIDSTLILRFTPRGRSGRIDLIHANVPDHDFRGISNGWKHYYWRPWRKLLRRK